MKSIYKYLFTVLLAAAFLYINLNFVYADELADESIKRSVEIVFEVKKPILEADKKNFGLNDSESFADATLGDGVPKNCSTGNAA